jgi:hypothetical protein
MYEIKHRDRLSRGPDDGLKPGARNKYKYGEVVCPTKYGHTASKPGNLDGHNLVDIDRAVTNTEDREYHAKTAQIMKKRTEGLAQEDNGGGQIV